MDYDVGVERRDVALRMLYRLYARPRGLQLLAELGLDAAAAHAAFRDQPYPRTEALVFQTLARCPQLTPVIEESLRRYIQATAPARRAYYNTKKAK